MMNEAFATLAFGLLALLLLFIGVRRGFFHFPLLDWEVPVRLVHLIGAFAIYFIVTYLGSKLAITFLKKEIMANYMGYSSWLNFGVSAAVFMFLALYMIALPPPLRKAILSRSGGARSAAGDVSNALYAWILAFPLVLFLSQALEWMVTKLFQVTTLPDQIAVKFLKSTFENPTYFILAVLSIIILAPLIEETLFRGFLQTYIRQHLGRRQAILITSACFSLFHYSAGQGLGNISIILSLFILSLFLGFLYEKQGSLFAPMILHSLFNTVSVINLYLFGGFTTGI
ncbi:MAG: type II CAAX endopeptidase family protein [Chlamydiales bacterium]